MTSRKGPDVRPYSFCLTEMIAYTGFDVLYQGYSSRETSMWIEFRMAQVVKNLTADLDRGCCRFRKMGKQIGKGIYFQFDWKKAVLKSDMWRWLGNDPNCGRGTWWLGSRRPLQCRFPIQFLATIDCFHFGWEGDHPAIWRSGSLWVDGTVMRNHLSEWWCVFLIGKLAK